MAKKKKTTSIDMTSGSPYRLILSFTMPLLLGNIFQQLYNMVDSVVVGKCHRGQGTGCGGHRLPHHFYAQLVVYGHRYRRDYYDFAVLRCA